MTSDSRTRLPLEAMTTLEPIDRAATAHPGAATVDFLTTAWVRRAVIIAILVVAGTLAARDLTDEGAVSLQGDMPRYMMNGVFLFDYFTSGRPWTINGLFHFAEQYYAQYPALSLGHHPPLLPVSLAPVYAVFGVSVFWSRIAIIGFFFLAICTLFSLASRLYDTRVAFWATLLFATNPAVVSFGQAVLSEMPMLALVLLAMNALVRFRDSSRARDYAMFVLCAVGSLYAKQLALFVLPVYVLFLLVFIGWRRVLRRDVILLTLLGLALCIPIAVITWVLSPFNVALVRFVSTNTSSRLSPRPSVLWAIATGHNSMLLLVIIAIGAIISIVRRDRRVALSLVWMTSSLLAVMFVTGRVDPPRYGMITVPAYFLCAAGPLAVLQSTAARRVAVLALSAAVVWHLWIGRDLRPTGADGYEAAAQYVLTQGSSPTILFSGPVDTGYFVFFVRKHDPERQHVVLRADKLLTTSRMGRSSIQDRIKEPHEIYALLKKYGTRYIVLEDHPSDSRVIDWLREEVKTSQFAERLRIPIVTADKRLIGISLAIFEYLEAQPPDPTAELDLNVPLVGRQVRVPLADLIDFDRQ
jgi:hypothetical protein